MAWYQERTIGSLTLLSRAAARFWREDKAQRPGRKSWFPLAAIVARRPYLRAQRLAQTRKPPS